MIIYIKWVFHKCETITSLREMGQKYADPQNKAEKFYNDHTQHL